MFYFQILSIQAGWFNVKISNQEKEAFLTNSWYMGNDAPKVLLENLNRLAVCERATCWLCWHDEPGAYIWHLSKERDSLHYNIAEAVKSSYKLPYEGLELEKEQLSGVILSGNVSFFVFFSGIVKSLGEYSCGGKLELYAKEWGEFPFDEFDKARQLLRRI